MPGITDRRTITPTGIEGTIDAHGYKGGPMEDAPLLAAFLNPLAAKYFLNDFHDYLSTAGWTTTQATAGTAVITDALGGVLFMDTGSSTTDQGPQVQQTGEQWALAAGRNLYFEARVKVADASAAQLFVGLAVTDTSLFASGELTAADYIGFEMSATTQAAAAGRLDFNLKGNATAEENEATVATLTDDTWVRLGFVVEGVSKVRIYVDGVMVESHDITNAPTTEMTISFAYLNEGSVDAGALSIDYVQCAMALADPS